MGEDAQRGTERSERECHRHPDRGGQTTACRKRIADAAADRQPPKHQRRNRHSLLPKLRAEDGKERSMKLSNQQSAVSSQQCASRTRQMHAHALLSRPALRFAALVFLLSPFAFFLLPSALAQSRVPVPSYGPMRERGEQQTGLPPALVDVRIDQRLNEQIPLDATFRDETGRTVQLREYFGGTRPVILSLVFYECPMLCNQVLNGMTATMKVMSLKIGEDYDVLTVSFDPHEKPPLALAKKESYIERYKRPGAAEGWHFLTGDLAAIERLTQAVG